MRAARLPAAGLGASHRHPSLLRPAFSRYPFAEPRSGCRDWSAPTCSARAAVAPTPTPWAPRVCLRLALAQAKCQAPAAFVTRCRLQGSVPAPGSQSPKPAVAGSVDPMCRGRDGALARRWEAGGSAGAPGEDGTPPPLLLRTGKTFGLELGAQNGSVRCLSHPDPAPGFFRSRRWIGCITRLPPATLPAQSLQKPPLSPSPGPYPLSQPHFFLPP